MGEATKELKAELERSLALLATLRDEVRVRIHLGSMDAKKQWNELEPRVQSAIDQAAKDVSNASHAVVREVTEALKKIKASLS
jgi:hypothetical protein